jgi:hypothetical protein
MQPAHTGYVWGEEWYFVGFICNSNTFYYINQYKPFITCSQVTFVSNHVIYRFGFCLINHCIKVYLAKITQCYVCKTNELHLLLDHRHKCTAFLTPFKLTVTDLVNNSLNFYGSWRFITMFKRNNHKANLIQPTSLNYICSLLSLFWKIE